MIQPGDIPEAVHSSPLTRKWICLDIAQMDYNDSLALQHHLVAARRDNTLKRDALILLEHPPVFTLGKRGGREHLRVPPDILKQAGVDIVQIERGGNITYHGPGQLVAYIIFDLNAARIGVAEFVHRLEEIMIRLAGEYRIAAQRNAANRGIWVGGNKLGSLGIAVRRGITFHGLALNVNPSLEPFSWINPCGLQNVGVTSIEKESSRTVAMQDVRGAFKRHFQSIFQARLEPAAASAFMPLPTSSRYETSP